MSLKGAGLLALVVLSLCSLVLVLVNHTNAPTMSTQEIPGTKGTHKGSLRHSDKHWSSKSSDALSKTKLGGKREGTGKSDVPRISSAHPFAKMSRMRNRQRSGLSRERRNSYLGRKIPRENPASFKKFLTRPNRRTDEGTDVLFQFLGKKIRKGSTVFDVGCGLGFHALPLSKLVGAEGKVVCVDAEPAFLKEATDNAKVEKASNMAFQQSMNFPAKSADLIFMADSYHEFGDPLFALQLAHHALRDDGRSLLCLLEYRDEDPDSKILPLHRMSKEQIVREVTAPPAIFAVAEGFDALPMQHLVCFAPTSLAEIERKSRGLPPAVHGNPFLGSKGGH